jgi:hypothetical protein
MIADLPDPTRDRQLQPVERRTAWKNARENGFAGRNNRTKNSAALNGRPNALRSAPRRAAKMRTSKE